MKPSSLSLAFVSYIPTEFFRTHLSAFPSYCHHQTHHRCMHQGALLTMTRRGLDFDGLQINGLGWLDSAIPAASLILSCQAVQTTLDHYVWQNDLRQCFFLTESTIFGIAAPHAVGLCVTRFKIFPLYKAERSKTLVLLSILSLHATL